MSVLLTQWGGKCPSGPGWNTVTKGFCKLYLVCVSVCLCEREQLSLCFTLCNSSWSSFGACSFLNVLIMCYTIFTILMAVTIQMQIRKGCWNVSKSPLALHWIPKSLSLNMYSNPNIILFQSNILLHKGSGCALFILSDIFRYACI